MEGRSLELYFIDGRPDGMLTAELFNWTGHILMAPRTRLFDALQRAEAGYCGVYILLGEDDSGTTVYIGESEDMARRIRQHGAGKDWWSSMVMVSATGNALNKAHIKYLEARLIDVASQVGSARIENGNTPVPPGLSESARANMEQFLSNILMVLPALRIDSFLERARPAAAPSRAPADGVAFELHAARYGLSARAELSRDELIVQAGSQARDGWTASQHGHSYRKLRDDLCRAGVLVDDGQAMTFTRNYAFSSPSAAAAVILGRPANDPLEWKRPGSRQTYRDWEAEQLSRQEAPL